MELEQLEFNIATNVKKLRKERGWLQRELAIEVGCCTQTIRAVESGERLPALRISVSLADAFAVTLDKLTGRE